MVLRNNDANHPFFLPLWRRVATLVVCAIWLACEIFFGDQMFAVIAAGILAYGIWSLLIAFDPEAARARLKADKNAAAGRPTKTDKNAD